MFTHPPLMKNNLKGKVKTQQFKQFIKENKSNQQKKPKKNKQKNPPTTIARRAPDSCSEVVTCPVHWLFWGKVVLTFLV